MTSRAPGRAADARSPVSLLTELTTKTVDPGYAEAAARRSETRALRTGEVGRSLALVALSLGLLGALAARDARVGAPERARTRAALADEVRRRAALSERLAAEVVAARAGLAEAEAARLGTSRTGLALAEQLRRLEAAVGAEPVRGPGFVVRLANAASGQDDASTDDGRIRDSDLQQVVNALWAAGAEAIAVNGQRVTALTAIRQAGEAIVVDYRPVAWPYEVSAVGNIDAVEPAFAESPVARRFHTFREVYGLGFTSRRVRRLELSAATLTSLRHAKRVSQ